MTYTGHYWTLYTRGSSSVHPDYGAIRRFLRRPAGSGYQRHYIVPEETEEQVSVFLSIAAFLMGEAIAVADAALGWGNFDDALRLLGRWDEVRAPGLLIAGIRLLLDGETGRRYGRSGPRLVSVEIDADGRVAIVVTEGATWTELTHQIGVRGWTLRDASGGESSLGVAGSRIDLGPVVMQRVELLAEAEWVDGRPGAWPEGAP